VDCLQADGGHMALPRSRRISRQHDRGAHTGDSVMPIAAPTRESHIVVPQEVFEIASESIGAFFEPLNRVDRKKTATDFLKFAGWIREFDVDAYGMEPGGIGFHQGYIASRKLLTANGTDQERVI